jgi:putative glutamine amidotransferase
VSAISDAGGIPLLIPATRPATEAGAYLDRIDGLCLSGGDDVDPGTYGRDNDCSLGVDASADAWEIELLRRAAARRMPSLCICRGVQVMNVAHGGTLHQEVLSSGGGLHEPLDDREVATKLADRHSVELSAGGRLSDIYQASVIEVNSLHHQAVDEIGDGLALEAVAPDGVIEGLAPIEQGWWAVGVQWHPERTGGADKALFEAFLGACSG